MRSENFIIVSKDVSDQSPHFIWSLSINPFLSRFLSDFEMMVIISEKLDQKYVTEFIDELRKLDNSLDEIKIEIDCFCDQVNQKRYVLSTKSHLHKFIGMDRITKSIKSFINNNITTISIKITSTNLLMRS